MQKSYPASELVVDQVVSEVRKAIRRNEWIMLVEYRNEGKTLRRVTKELKGYMKVRSVKKDFDCGAYSILWGLTFSTNNLNGLRTPRKRISHIKICGVNTNCCIIETVKGLQYLNSKITVLSKACANVFDFLDDTDNQREHKRALSTMKRWKNVYVQ
jgi:nicotinamidase-related amidase